jgi:EmrB/QacA subfamily drug resistance transporter
MPLSQAIMWEIFPLRQRGMAMAAWGMGIMMAPIFGPTLGGWISDNWSWRWIFYINVPIGIAALIATFLIVPDLRPGRHHGWDIVGVILATAGLFGVVFGLIEGERYNWGEIGSYVITIPEVIGGGLVLLVLFIIWERFQTEPLIPLSLFEERNFAVSNWIAAAISFGMMSLFLPITIYLQSVRGFSALVAGLTLAPMSLTSMLVAPFAGRFADRVGGKYILMSGISLFAIGAASLTFVAGPDSNWLTFLVPAIIAGAGMGMTFAPMTTVAMRNIAPRVAGAASGVLNTTRQLGAAIGSAVVGALLQNNLATDLHNQAVAHANALPAAARAQFVAAYSSVASSGFEIGTNQNGAKLPTGLPPDVAAQFSALAHVVFVNAYIDAMKATLVVPIAFLVLTAFTALLIKRRARPAVATETKPEEELTVAAS